MAIQDYTDGYFVRSFFNTQVVGTSVVQLISGNPKRVSLIISSPSTGSITLSFAGTFTAGQGLVLTSGGSPLYLDVLRHGDLCTRPLNVVGSTSSITVGWTESELQT